MTIVARHPGKCSVCGGPFAAGAKIEWRKDGARSITTHAACATGALASKPARERKTSAPRARRSPPPSGPQLRNDRSPYAVGDILVSQLTATEIAECEARQLIAATEIPGEPCKGGRRRVAVVVVHADRMSQSDSDDNGHCGRYGATVRLATSDEAAPIVDERVSKAQAKADAEAKERAWAAELASMTAGRIFVEGGAIERIGAEILHEERKGLHGTVSASARWSRLADGSILVERYAYDDDRWGRWVTTEKLLDEARGSDRSLEDAIRGQRHSAIDRAIVWLAAQAGKTPRPPVTVTLCGLSRPVTLEVTLEVTMEASRIYAGSMARNGQERVGERWVREWTWSIDQLRALLDSAPRAEVFADIEMAPGVRLPVGDRVALPDGLWIEGMGAALAQLEVVREARR